MAVHFPLAADISARSEGVQLVRQATRPTGRDDLSKWWRCRRSLSSWNLTSCMDTRIGQKRLFHLGRFDEAEKAFAVAAAHHATADELAGRPLPSGVAEAGQDRHGETRWRESRGNRDSELRLTQIQALAAARDGRLSEADRYSRSAIEMAIRAGLRERTAVFQAAPAVWNALYENKTVARATAETALKTFEGREVDYAAGFALGLAGESAKAEALADKTRQRIPGRHAGSGDLCTDAAGSGGAGQERPAQSDRSAGGEPALRIRYSSARVQSFLRQHVPDLCSRPCVSGDA